MAEWSAKWTTSGAGSGDQVAGYTQAYYKIIYEILSACLGFEGVAAGFLNELEGTVTSANTVQIDTGGALVDGHVYHNSAAEDVNIPNASGAGNTRIDRIVLRCDWTAFTVRLHRIAGTDAGSPTAPAITQTSGTTYDILLYQALVTTAGAVTLTDERTMATLSDDSIDSDMIQDEAVTPEKTSFFNTAGADGEIFFGAYTSITHNIVGPMSGVWTSTNLGTGKARITHNFGDTDYVVLLTRSPDNNLIVGASKSSNYFDIFVRDASGTYWDNIQIMFLVIRY
jgi:hypothetical protein